MAIAFIDGAKSEIVTFGKLDDGTAPDRHSVYEIGSITKTFTATLLAAAIDSGRDTAIEALLPAFNIPAHNGREITLADLATQSSGLPYIPDNFRPADAENPFADYGRTLLSSRMQPKKIDGGAFTSTVYSQ